MGKLYIYIYWCILYTLYCVYICVCFARGILYSAVLNLSTGCFAVYAKRINEWSRFPRHLSWSDPLVGGGLWSHGVERGAPPAAPGVVGSGAPGGQSTQAVTFLILLPLNYWLWYYITARLGAVAFTVLCCELSCQEV